MNTSAAVGADSLLYKNERPLFTIMLVFAVVAWLVLVIVTLGGALFYLLLFFLGYLFAQSALISYLRGTGTRISAEQFPDLHQRVVQCCQTLGMAKVPDVYLLHANGAFNAFATRFLGRNFVVLYSDVVDALESQPDAINFYIGHELGHIRQNHLRWGWFLFPASILPLLGAAYRRSQEYTCDLHGLACCPSREVASRGLGALAAGGRRWSSMDLGKFAGQAEVSGGFWMSFHELLSSYPWLVKRMLRILPVEHAVPVPKRNPFAWILALFVPRLGLGGSGASLLVVVAIIGILAAIAIPAYQDYIARAKIVGVIQEGTKAGHAVAAYYDKNNAVPATLEQAGVSSGPNGNAIRAMSIEPGGTIHLELAFPPLEGKAVLFVPSRDEQKKIVWKCTSQDIPVKYLPSQCKP